MTEQNGGGSVLDQGDLEMLLDALDALESKDERDRLTASLFGIMTANSKEEAKSRADELKREHMQGKQKHKQLSERIILLKAKLIRQKDALLAQGFADDVLKGKQP